MMAKATARTDIWMIVTIVIIAAVVVNMLTVDSLAAYIVIVAACFGVIIGDRTGIVKLPDLSGRKWRKK